MIYLLRHGETPGNAGRVIQTPDVPLSPRGEEQARQAARRVASAGITRILASDYTRAAQTASALGDAATLPVEYEPLLQERNLGELRGRPYAELDFDVFAADYEPPGGESWETFHLRVSRAWERVLAVAADTTGDLAVVTHGLVCFSLATRQLTLPEGAVVDGGFGNTSLTIVEPRPPHVVRLFNCTAHLEEVRSGGRA